MKNITKSSKMVLKRIFATSMALVMCSALLPTGISATPNSTAGKYTLGSSGDIKAGDYYAEKGMGYRDVTFPDEAAGWVNSVYYPRVAATSDNNSFVTDHDGYVEITSRVWTETESTGYGVYTYEETSTLDFALENRDYIVTVELYNPTATALTVSLESEDITKVSGISVAAYSTVTESFTACLIDGILNLKFLETTNSYTTRPSTASSVYVKSVTIEAVANKAAGEKPTIYIASDSTVQTYESGYYPQTGWGETLFQFFGEYISDEISQTADFSQAHTYETENVIIENRAIGGRSSKSFIEEGKLDDLLEDIRPGDYLFVQWAHNDATYSRPNRYVSVDDFDDYLQVYIDGATQRGATCVLVTPVARYSYDSEGSFKSDFDAYRQVMIKIAEEQNIPLIDLTAASIELCNSLGVEGAKSLFMHLDAGVYDNYPSGQADSTHLQYYGAYKFAQCVAKEITTNTHSALSSLKGLVALNIPTTAPETPTGLAITNTGASSVTMSWEEADGAELYYIYRQQLSEGETIDDVDFSNATKYSVSVNTTYTDSNCEGGNNYVYAVRSFNEYGLSDLSDKVQANTLEATYRYDFGIVSSSNVMEGWLEVTENQMYIEAAGYGWLEAPGGGRNRSNNGNADSSAMADDFCLGAGTFAVDLPNGDYELKIYAGDLLTGTSTIKPSYTAEGVSIGTISTKQAIGTLTATVRVTDGQLTLTVGGTNPYINGLEITPLTLTPTALTIKEEDFSNSPQVNFLINFTGISNAVYYNIYSKLLPNGTWQVAKKVTAEELANDSNIAMVGTVGQVYQFYVTAVLADGTESAASNTVEFNCVDESVTPPSAPQNLAYGTVESGNIEISWDAVAGAHEYIIYRSNKAESDKAFTGFTQIGTSATNSYTDNDKSVVTTINYYYKVQAVNAGGAGEMSAALQTPITTTLTISAEEKLTDRAVVAINLSGDAGAETLVATDANGNEYTGGVYLSWRSFEDDPDGTTFTVYRNGSVIAENISVTNLVDQGGSANATYRVEGSSDGSLSLNAKEIKPWNNQYLELQLNKPEDQVMPDGTVATYHANDMSVGDLDGDGEYELVVKWQPSNAKDNSAAGYTGTTILDGYNIDFNTGVVQQLWRIDLGVNIRSGAHYTQFQVWDYDGDGKAEIAVKTADGSTTYQNTDNGLVQTGYIGACDTSALPTNSISGTYDYRNSSGYILEGDEYFTIFRGDTGEIIDTVAYMPGRGNVASWGDSYGNRVDRFLAATAYLDGEKAYAVFCRGYYTRSCLTAYELVDTNGDGVGDKIEVYWQFDTNNLANSSSYEHLGNHSLSVNDVDGDGFDEIIYGALVVDHDGTVLYALTNLSHGDAMHVSDWVPWNDGLEIMSVFESSDAQYHVALRDAETGKILSGFYVGADTGRGAAGDIDPTSPGAEYWAGATPAGVEGGSNEWDSVDGGVWAATSGIEDMVWLAYNNPPANFTIFWDGDLLMEIFDHTFNSSAYVPIATTITKWDYLNNTEITLFDSSEVYTSNGTKGNAGLVADFLGDWREEVILRCASDNSKIRVYSTTIYTDYVVPCLMENRAYREGIAWQNTGYNQPANLDYLLSEGVITSSVGVGNATASSLDVLFTEASDGVYGHDIEGYQIWRSSGDNETELVAEIALNELQYANSNTEIVEGEEIYKFNFHSNKSTETRPESYINLTGGAYSTETGYGFTDESGTLVLGIGGWLGDRDEWIAGGGDADLYDVCASLVYTTGDKLEFRVDLEPGTYKVDVYASAGYNNSAYNNNTVYVNSESLGQVYGSGTSSNSSVATPDIIRKTITVEVGDDGYILVEVSGATRSMLNALVITEMVEQTIIEGDIIYTYTDSGLEANTTYSYSVSAIVNGRSSYMSHSAEGTTLISIASVNEIVLDDIAVNTPLEEGQTVADLLPSTVSVIDSIGNEQQAPVTWDVSEVDINTVGAYTVYATVLGWEVIIPVALNVVEDYPTGITELEDITITVGTEPELPETLVVTFLSTITDEVAVTWDETEANYNEAGEYILTGTLEGYGEGEVDVPITATIKVIVVDDYIVSVEAASVEVTINTAVEDIGLPETVTATWVSGNTTEVNVSWETANINTSVIGTYSIYGAVSGFEDGAELVLSVVYELYARFDFGISSSQVEDGWTGVTVNAKSGTKTSETLDIHYTEDKGWGFENATSVIEGRDEGLYSEDTTLPENVFRDFVLPSDQTFIVDVENGTYQVEVYAGSYYSSSVKVIINSSSTYTISNSAGAYKVGTYEVEATDGQLVFYFPSNTSRMNAIVIRQISASGEGPVIGDVDKSKLQELYDSVSGYDSDSYTTNSWAAFYGKLGNARDLLDKDNATQDEVNEMVVALQAAIDGLISRVDVSALKELISYAGSLDPSQYTAESYSAIADPLGVAMTLVSTVEGGTELSADEISEAYNALQVAIGNLVLESDDDDNDDKIVDASTLGWLISVVEGMNLSSEDYTEDSLYNLTSALANARDVYNSEDKTQSRVDAAVAELLNAISYLTEVEKEEPVDPEGVDKSGLLSTIQNAAPYINNSSIYTEDSWAVFQDTYAAAIEALVNNDNQDDVNAAANALNIAIGNLEEKSVIEVTAVTGGITVNGDNTTVYTRLESSSVDVSYTFAASKLTYAKEIQLIVNYNGSGVMSYSGINVVNGLTASVDGSTAGKMVIKLTAEDSNLLSGDDIELFTLNFSVNGEDLAAGSIVRATATASDFVVLYYNDGDTNSPLEAETSLDPKSANKDITFIYSVYDVVMDKTIDEKDINYVVSQFGKQGYNTCDFNGDGVVDIIDLTMILAAYAYDTSR